MSNFPRSKGGSQSGLASIDEIDDLEELVGDSLSGRFVHAVHALSTGNYHHHYHCHYRYHHYHYHYRYRNSKPSTLNPTWCGHGCSGHSHALVTRTLYRAGMDALAIRTHW